MKLASWYSVVAFIHGMFIKIVDDMYDNNVLPKFKLIANIILQLITIYILFFTKYFGLIWSLVIVFGGMGGIILARDTVSAPPWMLTIILGMFGLIYHLPILTHYFATLSYKKLKEVLCYIIPSLIIIATFQLLEEKNFPEEYSKRKLIERLAQALVFQTILRNKKKIQKIIQLSKDHMQWIEWQIWLGQGYLWTNIITMLYLLYKH